MNDMFVLERRLTRRRQRISSGRRASEVEEFLKLVAERRAQLQTAENPQRTSVFLRRHAMKAGAFLAIGSMCVLLHRTSNRDSAQDVYAPSGTPYQWSGYHRVGPHPTH